MQLLEAGAAVIESGSGPEHPKRFSPDMILRQTPRSKQQPGDSRIPAGSPEDLEAPSRVNA